MQISVTIPSLEEAKRRFARMPAVVVSHLDKAIKNSAFVVEGKAKNELGGVNGGWDTGRLASSIRPEFGVLRAEISPHVDYAIYLHEGTRPHWVPISAIAPWANRHNIPPAVVQRSIAQKGTKANPFMVRAAQASQPDIDHFFAKAVELIVNTI